LLLASLKSWWNANLRSNQYYEMNIKTCKKILKNISFSQTRNTSRVEKGQNLKVWSLKLTEEDILRKYEEQGGRCYWLGIRLNEKYNYEKKHPLAISVDRIDNSKGYEYDNIVLCLRVLNLGRGSYEGDFREIIDILMEELNDRYFQRYFTFSSSKWRRYTEGRERLRAIRDQ
jgi:hypothetical protein